MKLQTATTFSLLLLAASGMPAQASQSRKEASTPSTTDTPTNAPETEAAGHVRGPKPVEYPIDIVEPNNAPTLLEQARPLTRGEILARFDRNIDGKLDPKEASDSRREIDKRLALQADLVRRYDVNKNGRLDAVEMSRARADFAAARQAELLARFDKNQDGVLDPSERKELQIARDREQALWRLQRRFDRNQDNRLDREEALAMERYCSQQRKLGLDPLLPDPSKSLPTAEAKSEKGEASAREANSKVGTKESTTDSTPPRPRKNKKKEQRGTPISGPSMGYALLGSGI